MLTSKTLRNFVVAICTIGVPSAVMLPACAEQADNISPLPNQPVDNGEQANDGNDDVGEGICLLNNCNADTDCAGCEDGRDTCLVDENRCVACDPVSGEGCADGEQCSPYGLCVPFGLTCPTDGEGEPTLTCGKNSDCAACSPMHQVCDTNTGTCQACTATNTNHCLSTDMCLDGKCSPKCPQTCDGNNDCSQCAGPGGPLNACNAHQCAECSDSWPCAAGLECVSGSCVPQCGLPGPTAGGCVADEDCAYCGDGQSAGSWDCKKPINANGPNDHGTCTPKAGGCSDIGSGVAVLPEPWDDVTNLCSSDNDCSGVGITYSVSDLIKDAINADEINLGFTKVEIQDANITYGMNTCADIELTDNLSCGVCVPCEVDADCKPIQIDPLIGDLFAGDPLATIAGSLLLDLLFGNNANHDINFFCQPVAAGYGVCAPCANPFQACGSGGGGGGNVGSGSCDHDVCDEGTALDGTCDSCAEQVCNNDAYCCTTEWDDICVGEVDQYCGAGTCSGGGGGGSNCHDVCDTGPKLSAACGSCAASVCAQDSFCCDTEWDQLCVDTADQLCASCGGGGGGNNNNCHDVCDAGPKLSPACGSCAVSVCNQDSYCCDVEWDSLCVDLADQYCGGC